MSYVTMTLSTYTYICLPLGTMVRYLQEENKLFRLVVASSDRLDTILFLSPQNS